MTQVYTDFLQDTVFLTGTCLAAFALNVTSESKQHLQGKSGNANNACDFICGSTASIRAV